MPINQITKAQIESEILSIGTALKQTLNVQALNWANAVVAIGVTALQAAPYSYSSGDANLLFNAAQDLLNCRLVYQGLKYVVAGATQNSGVPTANDGTHFGYPFNINVDQCDGFGD